MEIPPHQEYCLFFRPSPVSCIELLEEDLQAIALRQLSSAPLNGRVEARVAAIRARRGLVSDGIGTAAGHQKKPLASAEKVDTALGPDKQGRYRSTCGGVDSWMASGRRCASSGTAG